MKPTHIIPAVVAAAVVAVEDCSPSLLAATPVVITAVVAAIVVAGVNCSVSLLVGSHNQLNRSRDV